MIVLDLNRNDSDALLRHIEEFRPGSGDVGEDARLRDALLELLAKQTMYKQKRRSNERRFCLCYEAGNETRI